MCCCLCFTVGRCVGTFFVSVCMCLLNECLCFHELVFVSYVYVCARTCMGHKEGRELSLAFLILCSAIESPTTLLIFESDLGYVVVVCGALCVCVCVCVCCVCACICVCERTQKLRKNRIACYMSVPMYHDLYLIFKTLEQERCTKTLNHWLFTKQRKKAVCPSKTGGKNTKKPCGSSSTFLFRCNNNITKQKTKLSLYSQSRPMAVPAAFDWLIVMAHCFWCLFFSVSLLLCYPLLPDSCSFLAAYLRETTCC